MDLQQKPLLGINITIDDKKKILEKIDKYIKKAQSAKRKANNEEIKPLIIFTPNPEIIAYSQKDTSFKQIVQSAQINLPDGAGVCFGLKKIYQKRVQRISGFDFMLDLCAYSQKGGFTIGLIGGRNNVALKTKECLITKYPSLKVEVLEEPEIMVSGIRYQVSGIKKNIPNTKYLILNTKVSQTDKTELYFRNLVQEMIEKKIDILFVALGFPKQEYFIDKLVSYWLLVHRKEEKRNNNYHERTLVLMAVGGSFDYMCGRTEVAPSWMRDNGLEWLYRLIHEPWRLMRMVRGARFFYEVIRSSVSI